MKKISLIQKITLDENIDVQQLAEFQNFIKTKKSLEILKKYLITVKEDLEKESWKYY